MTGGDEIDVRRVLAGLVRDEEEVVVAARELGLPRESLATWRDALLDAGLTVLGSQVQPVGWLQAEISLDGSAGQYEELLRSPLIEHLEAWVVNGVVTNAWYMHKPPGLRLRVEGRSGELSSLLGPALDEVVRRAGATRWRSGVYLPETHLFGGTAGMALAHRFFTADSLAILAYHRARLDHATTLGPADLSIVLLDRCLAAMVPGMWERWDVWCRLRWADRLIDDALADARGPAAFEAVEWVRTLSRLDGAPPPGLTPAEGQLLERFGRRVDELATMTERAIEKEELKENLRRVLPFWIAFHWNRMGLALDAQQALAGLVAAALDPRGPGIE